MPNSTRLVETAVAVRAGSPQEWQSFVDALREYSVSVNAEMVKCAPELLLRAQGMSIMANEITAIMVAAPQLHEKIMASRMGKKNG